MTGSVALDVVIGLIFIFLLYSLLATIVCEIIATNMGLRARNLHEAIRRMLEDDRVQENSWRKALFNNLKLTYQNLFKSPGRPITKEFYSQPTIKYLARSDFFSKPSYITPQTFSKTIIEIFRKYGKGNSDLDKIQNVIKGEIEFGSDCLAEFRKFVSDYFDENGKVDESKVDKNNVDAILNKINSICDVKKTDDSVFEQRVKLDIKKLIKDIQKKKLSSVSDVDKVKYVVSILKRGDRYLKLFEAETLSHISSLLMDSNNDLVKFRLHLEGWFNETMERAIGWYKQKIQVVLIIVGLVIAIWFNASTLEIIHTLSVDKNSRDQMVQMATSYVEHHKDFTLSDSLDAKARLDSLEKTRKQVQRDMNAANSILGLGWEFPNKLNVYNVDTLTKIKLEDYLVVTLDSGAKGIVLLPENVDKRKFFQLVRTSHDGINAVKYWFINVYNWFCNKPQVEPCVLAFEEGNRVYLSEWKLFYRNLPGYLLTALAISLGAPFWFDMLSKLVQIRGSIQQPVQQPTAGTTTGSSNDAANPLNRKG